MKKQFLFLAGAALILASCGSNNNAPQGPTQAQMDSMNNVLAQHDAANAAKADSILKEKEKAEAVAREHEGSGKKHEGKTEKPAEPVATPTVAPAAPTKTAQDNKFDRRNGTSNNATNTLTPDQQKAQDDKFNRRSK